MSAQLRRGQARILLGIVVILATAMTLGGVGIVGQVVASVTHWPAAQAVADVAHYGLSVMAGIVPMLAIGYAYWHAGRVRLDREDQPAAAIGPTIIVGAAAVAEALGSIRHPITFNPQGEQTFRVRRIIGHVHPITLRPFDLPGHDRRVAEAAIADFLADHAISKADIRRISTLNKAAHARRIKGLEID